MNRNFVFSTLNQEQKMSTSPPNYDFDGDPLLEAYMNAKFSEEISEKMKVPKRISAAQNGIHDQEHDFFNGHNDMNSWAYNQRVDMTVPDRIVVLGQDQHLGIYSLLHKFFEHHNLTSFS